MRGVKGWRQWERNRLKGKNGPVKNGREKRKEGTNGKRTLGEGRGRKGSRRGQIERENERG